MQSGLGIKPTESEEKILISTVKHFGGDMHTFVALQELSKYHEAKLDTDNPVFTSNLWREGDGKTNGPMFALISNGLIGDESDTLLGEMGGFFTEDSEFNHYGTYSKTKKQDLYKVISSGVIEWMKGKNEKGWPRVNSNRKQFLDMVLSTSFVKGSNIVTGKERALSKDPITQVIYGASVSKTARNLSESFFTGNSFFGGWLQFIENNQNNPEKIHAAIRVLNKIYKNKPERQIKIVPVNKYLEHSFKSEQMQGIKDIMFYCLMSTLQNKMNLS